MKVNKAQKTPSYKMTEIGRIPEEWDVRTLGEICEVTKNKGQERKFPYIEIGDIDVSSKRYIKKNKLSLKGCLAVRRGTMLISRVRPTRGAITLVHDDIVYASPAFTALKGKNVNNDYLFQYLAFNKDFFSFLGSTERGSTYPSCKEADILSYKIAVPLPQEQKKIASILSTIDDAIQKTDEVIQKAQELKRGLMQQLLIKGTGHTEFKQTELGEIPIEWEVVKLKDIAPHDRPSVQTGPFGAQLKSSEFTDHGVPVLNIGNVQNGYLDLTNLDHVKPEKAAQLERYRVRSGDLLFSRMATVGRTAIVPEECQGWLISYHLMRISLDETKCVPRFVMYYLLGSEALGSQIRRSIIGATRAGVNTTIIESMKITLPLITEQQKIVSILSAIDKKIEKERQRKSQLEKLKKGLVQDLLTGRVRVRAE